jgi:hypothetical protein
MREVDEGLMGTADALARPSDHGADEQRRTDPPSATARGRLNLERLAEEETLRLIYKLFMAADDRKRRIVLFAGIERDNGCAAMCLRAARTLATLQPGSVCLVDANLRSLHIAETNNLWVVPSVSSEPDSGPVLTLARLRTRLRELCARFEHILISAPPLDLHTASPALGHAVDGVVLVVSAHATRRDAVARTKSRLDDLQVPVLGVVFNDRTYPIPQFLYRLV